LRRRHSLLASAKTHPPRLLAFKPSRVELDHSVGHGAAAHKADSIAKAARLLEIHGGSRQFHSALKLFQSVLHALSTLRAANGSSGVD
jgi:hypothetical protein